MSLSIPSSFNLQAKLVEQEDTQFVSALAGQKRKILKQGCSVLPPSTEHVLNKLKLPKGEQAQYKKIADKPITPCDELDNSVTETQSIVALERRVTSIKERQILMSEDVSHIRQTADHIVSFLIDQLCTSQPQPS